MCGTISAASCSGPEGSRGARRRSTSRDRLLAQLDRAAGRTGAARCATARRHSTWTLLARGRRPGRRPRLGQHLRQHLGIERALVERDFAHAGHRRDDARLDVDDADRAHHAGRPASCGGSRCRERPARFAPPRETRRGASGSASIRNAPPGRRSAACDARRRTSRARRRSAGSTTRAPAPARCAARDRRARRWPSAPRARRACGRG